jgi:hypothetical protein
MESGSQASFKSLLSKSLILVLEPSLRFILLNLKFQEKFGKTPILSLSCQKKLISQALETLDSTAHKMYLKDSPITRFTVLSKTRSSRYIMAGKTKQAQT